MHEKLHPVQIAILIYMIQSGVTLFSIPRLSAETFGTNGWVGLIGIYALVNLNILLIVLVFKWGKGKSIFDIYEGVFPFWLLVPVYFASAVLFITLGMMVAKKFILLLQMLFFHETPTFVFMSMTFILCYIMLQSGIYQIAKITVSLFFLTIWTIFLLGFIFPEFSFTRLTPFFFKGSPDLAGGIMNVYTAFLGFELSLFLFPYVKEGWTKALFIGNGITTIIYISVTFISFGFLSFDQLLNDMYPVITILEYIKFPFIERVENLIFSLFALKVIMTIVMYLWTGKLLLEHSFKAINPTFITFSILAGGYLISLVPNIIREVDLWLKWLTNIIAAAAIVVPITLMFTILLHKYKEKARGDSS
ncbi:spore germination protein [Cytobacillus spongiae]|jgi:spore germination protein (amino acid permease)|uniref:GerAB/ArcD/ProY family transporter n=1 Tax=Cytobacillus spongiae TaxID=2901381 RepID=UPI001F2B29BE|nr:GerAB/ArcD/ProY family transporter [Cytobacillus spongiae]UII57097.1 spore germination protein [Cytobacillus spongiae]